MERESRKPARHLPGESGAPIINGFLAWIVVGLIAGWLAGKLMKGGGYGILVDIILGILGGVLGGWIFGFWAYGKVGA